MNTRETTDHTLAAASPNLERPERTRCDEPPPPVQPLALAFKEGRFAGATPRIADAWQLGELHLQSLCRVTPIEHSLADWRARVDRGEAMLLLFADVEIIIGAGLLECGYLDDGRKATIAVIMTNHQLDLSDLAAILETVACVTETECAWLWTPTQQDLLPGYEREACVVGFAQSVHVAPLN